MHWCMRGLDDTYMTTKRWSLQIRKDRHYQNDSNQRSVQGMTLP